jgi:hypothetical protein
LIFFSANINPSKTRKRRDHAQDLQEYPWSQSEAL